LGFYKKSREPNRRIGKKPTERIMGTLRTLKNQDYPECFPSHGWVKECLECEWAKKCESRTKQKIKSIINQELNKIVEEWREDGKP
jgi:hypothetical protein